MNTLHLPHFNTMARHTCELVDGNYGNSHHTTRGDHKRRTNTMLQYFCGVFDVKKLTDVTQDMRLSHLYDMLARHDEGELTINTLHNYNSTLNTVFSLARGDDQLRIEGSDYLPSRSTIRTTPPSSMHVGSVLDAGAQLRANGYPDFGFFLPVMRGLGLRRRETVMQDYVRLLDSLDNNNTVRIIEGAKGGIGRHTHRRVPLPLWLVPTLNALAERQGDRRNVIPADLKRGQFLSALYYQYNRVRDDHGLAHLHDLRASAACTWYEQITGMPAPVFTDKRVSRALDEQARLEISHRLGHHRLSVCTYYIGTKKGYQ